MSDPRFAVLLPHVQRLPGRHDPEAGSIHNTRHRGLQQLSELRRLSPLDEANPGMCQRE